MDKVKPPPQPKAPPPPSGPRRETGPATLGVTADSSTPWSVRVGETTKLRLIVVNTGGPANGLWVELGGQAITGNHVAGGAGFTGLRSVLESASLSAAEVRESKEKGPPGPKPSTSVEVEVRGVKVGKVLFTVRIGPMTPKGPGAAGSALCGRTIDVTE